MNVPAHLESCWRAEGLHIVRLKRDAQIMVAGSGRGNSVVLVFCGLGESFSRWVCRLVEGERGRFSFISLYDR